MSTTFSRSLRSLEADSFLHSLWGLFLGAALLATLTAWLFIAQVAVYEVADTAHLEAQTNPKEIKVIAYFPRTALAHLQVGQPARVRLTGFPRKLSAQVVNVAGAAAAGPIRVELRLLSDPNSPLPWQPGFVGTAEVEIERVSPATLVLRAAGQWPTPRQAGP